MSILKNGVLLRNRKAENQPLMKVICSLLLLAPCLSALMISCCKYFLINVKLKMRWFSANGKYYYSAGHCDKHGYIKAKVRIRKSENQKVFAIKTLKFISEEEMMALKEKRSKSKR